jgi:hypothetical protein
MFLRGHRSRSFPGIRALRRAGTSVARGSGCSREARLGAGRSGSFRENAWGRSGSFGEAGDTGARGNIGPYSDINVTL